MRDEYDFSNAKRAYEVPHLAKHQAEMLGKSKVTSRIDNKILAFFKSVAGDSGYQTLINDALREYAEGHRMVSVVRETITEVLSNKGA
jgi:uncharacterized protein (DUF4415 family)